MYIGLAAMAGCKAGFTKRFDIHTFSSDLVVYQITEQANKKGLLSNCLLYA